MFGQKNSLRDEAKLALCTVFSLQASTKADFLQRMFPPSRFTHNFITCSIARCKKTTSKALRSFATGLLTKSQLDLTQAQFFPSNSRRGREAQQSDNQFLLTYQVVVNSLVTTRHFPDCQMLWVIISTFAAWVFFFLAFARVRSCTMHA